MCMQRPTTTAIITNTARAYRAAYRMGAAYARHAVTLPEVIHLTAHTHSSDDNHVAIFEDAERSTTNTIKLLWSEDGTNLLYELLTSYGNDCRADRLSGMVANMAVTNSNRKAARAMANKLQSIADRVKTPADEAQEAAEAAADYRRQADTLRDDEQTLKSANSGKRTPIYSDRADLRQEAMFALWQTGNIKMGSKAIRKAIRALAHPDAKTGARTDWWLPEDAPECYRRTVIAANLPNDPYLPQSDEDIAEGHAPRYRHVDAITTRGQRDGYLTYQYRLNDKKEKVWYIVHHRYTVAPYMSYETFATGEGSEAIAKNDGINGIYNITTKDIFEAKIAAAKLSPRERDICTKLIDNTSRAEGAAAVRKAADIAEANGTTLPEAQRARIRKDAIIESAMRRSGIISESRYADVMCEIRKKLKAVTDAAAITAIQRADQPRAVTAARPATVRPSEAIAPTVTYTGNDYGAKPTEYATYSVQFVETITPDQMHTITEDERRALDEAREAARRQYLIRYGAERMLLEYRRAMRDHEPTRRAYAAHDALTAAYVFFEAMSHSEQLEVVAAATAAKAAAAKATYHAAYASALEQRRKAAESDRKLWSGDIRHNTKLAERQRAKAADFDAAATAAREAAAAATSPDERRKLERRAASAAAAARRARDAAAAHDRDIQTATRMAASIDTRATEATKLDTAALRRRAIKMAAWAQLTAAAARMD